MFAVLGGRTILKPEVGFIQLKPQVGVILLKPEAGMTPLKEGGTIPLNTEIGGTLDLDLQHNMEVSIKIIPQALVETTMAKNMHLGGK